MTEFEEVKVQKILKVLRLCKLRPRHKEFLRGIEESLEKTGKLTRPQIQALYKFYERI